MHLRILKRVRIVKDDGDVRIYSGITRVEVKDKHLVLHKDGHIFKEFWWSDILDPLIDSYVTEH